MKRINRIALGEALLGAFVLWTAAVCTVDVQPIGPQGGRVGLASVNGWFHHLTGVHMPLYTLTDWLSLIPAGFAAGFGLLGLGQWIKRKDLRQVDRDILLLGGFYIAVLAVYLFFEKAALNNRPVLIEGALEASYPSSTTVLVLCVMGTAKMQLKARLRNGRLKKWALRWMDLYTAGMIFGRLLSGVHWLSDIVGGVLISCGLVVLYGALRRK